MRVLCQVHERTVEGDFLMLTLRDLLVRGRPAGAPPLHVCLMSATLDSAALANYFGVSTPRVKFGGRAFPVTSLHLETALGLVRHVVRPDADWSLGSKAAQKRRQARLEQLADGEEPPPPPPTEAEWTRRLPEAAADVWRALARLDPSAVNVGLICELLVWYKVSLALHGTPHTHPDPPPCVANPDLAYHGCMCACGARRVAVSTRRWRRWEELRGRPADAEIGISVEPSWCSYLAR